MKRSVISLIMILALLITSIMPVFADAEMPMSEDDRVKEILEINAKPNNEEILIFGDTLTKEQMEALKKEYNVSGKDIPVLYISNQEERDALLKYVPEKIVGTRAISSAYIRLNSNESDGILVKTNNISWVTEDMYRNALLTAGVKNATVLVSAPFRVSGTAALTGTMKAYEEISGETLDTEKKDVANEEMIKTVELSDEIGKEDAEKIMSEVKYTVIENKIKDPKEIENVINNVANQNNITLTEEQKANILQLMERISNLDINVNDIKTQLSDIVGKLDNIDINTDKAQGFLKSIFESIKNFFSGLFNKKTVEPKESDNKSDITEDPADDVNDNKTDDLNSEEPVNKDTPVSNEDKDEHSENINDSDQEDHKTEIISKQVQVEQDTGNEAANNIKVGLKTLTVDDDIQKMDISKYNGGFFQEPNSLEILELTPKTNLNKIEVVALDFQHEELVEMSTMFKLDELKANETLGLNVNMTEGIPMTRVKWMVGDNSYYFDVVYDGQFGFENTILTMD